MSGGPQTCLSAGCDLPGPIVRGFCGTHYKRARRSGGLSRLTPVERFWEHVEKTPHCWLWLRRSIDQYGSFFANGVRTRPHRFSWELHNGPIPDGLFVCHRCDRPRCVRPDHLFVATNAENTADKIRKGRLRNASTGPLYLAGAR